VSMYNVNFRCHASFSRYCTQLCSNKRLLGPVLSRSERLLVIDGAHQGCCHDDLLGILNSATVVLSGMPSFAYPMIERPGQD
jgi:hypothetical protein